VARLIYSAIASLDGYVADEGGSFDWAAPDEDVHRFVNDLERPIGTYLYGRRMYETMVFWELADVAHMPPAVQDYAEIWRAADKVVYSTALEAVSTARTHLERAFEPDAVRRLKAEAAADISVGGPGLAAQAIEADLVDEYQLFVAPVLVGGGTPWLPGGIRLDLELLDERRFPSSVVFLRYRARQQRRAPADGAGAARGRADQ
jgi:dihydrofolate reductase